MKKKMRRKKPRGYILPDGSGFFVMTVPTKKERTKKKRKNSERTRV